MSINIVQRKQCFKFYVDKRAFYFVTFPYPTGPGCSKLAMSLVNETLKFQTLISQICQYFLMKKCEKLAVQKLLSFFQQKISLYLVIKL